MNDQLMSLIGEDISGRIGPCIESGEVPQHYTRILSQYYLELERLLIRTGESTSHYCTLAVGRKASKDEVTQSYRQAIKMLEPVVDNKVPGLSEDLVARGTAALTTLSEAFEVLSHFGKRTYYDNGLTRPYGSRTAYAAATAAAALYALDAIAVIPASAEQSDLGEGAMGVSASMPPDCEPDPCAEITAGLVGSSNYGFCDDPALQVMSSPPELERVSSLITADMENTFGGGGASHLASAAAMNAPCDGEPSSSVETSPADNLNEADQNNGAVETDDGVDWVSARIPLEITGCDQQGVLWAEVVLATRNDRGELMIKTARPLVQGYVLQTTALSRNHGSRQDAGTAAKAYAVVTAVEGAPDGGFAITAAPIGPRPPEGYQLEPWATFDAGTWPTAERRESPRIPITEALRIEYLDKNDVTLFNGIAVTENVSAGGARIYVEAAPREFDKVRVASVRNLFNAMAMMRNRYRGKDGFERICLEFIDRSGPGLEPLFLAAQ